MRHLLVQRRLEQRTQIISKIQVSVGTLNSILALLAELAKVKKCRERITQYTVLCLMSFDENRIFCQDRNQPLVLWETCSL